MLARTNSDRTHREYRLTIKILDTIDFLRQIDATALGAEHNYIYEAYSAIVQCVVRISTFTKRRPGFDVQEVLAGSGVECSLRENAFAFSAYLGLARVVEYFIEQEVRDVRTCFGSPLDCAAMHSDSTTTYSHLKARDLRRVHNDSALVRGVSLYVEDRAVGGFWCGSPNDIHEFRYHQAIRKAIWFSASETVEALVDSAVENHPSYCFVDGFGRTAWTFGAHKTEEHGQENTLWSSILLCAVKMMRTDVARLALDRGADANVKAGNITALETAA